MKQNHNHSFILTAYQVNFFELSMNFILYQLIFIFVKSHFKKLFSNLLIAIYIIYSSHLIQFPFFNYHHTN